jgi:hypothetical protein
MHPRTRKLGWALDFGEKNDFVGFVSESETDLLTPILKQVLGRHVIKSKKYFPRGI